jgi:predicted RNase H-like HicB family nuclease
MNIDYAVQIIWSEEDQAYIAACIELPGCLADGPTPEEALANLRKVIAEWLEVAAEEGRNIPRPFSREKLESMAREQARKLNEQMNERVKKMVAVAVRQVLAHLIPDVESPLGFFQSSRVCGLFAERETSRFVEPLGPPEPSRR